MRFTALLSAAASYALLFSVGVWSLRRRAFHGEGCRSPSKRTGASSSLFGVVFALAAMMLELLVFDVAEVFDAGCVVTMDKV